MMSLRAMACCGLIAARAALAQSAQSPAGAPAQGAQSRAAVELPVPTSLRGRVVDGSGWPLVSVRVVRAGSSSGSPTLRDAGAIADLPHCLTDATGAFGFTGLPSGEHRLFTERTDMLDAGLTVVVVAGRDHTAPDLALRPGMVVRGLVVATDGRPITGAEVCPVRANEGLSRQRAVRTGADGGFVLRAVSSFGEIQVRAEGHAEVTATLDANQDPVRVTLTPTSAVRGRVTGQGDRPTTVALQAMGSVPLSVYRILGRPVAVAADGGFEIAGLTPGEYSVVATTGGYGRSVSVSFTLPRTTPVELAVRADQRVAVHVRDEQGNPIARAQVVASVGPRDYEALYRADASDLAERVHRDQAEQSATTDTQGLAVLLLPPDEPRAVGAREARHLPAAVVLQAGRIPERCELTLVRAGWIHGRVADGGARAHHALSVAFLRPGEPASAVDTPGRLVEIDDEGRFRSRALRPGRWSVAVHRSDLSWMDETRRARGVEPLLGEGTDMRQNVACEVAPGGTTEVLVPVARLGLVQGRVRSGTEPAGGILVFAVEADPRARRVRGSGARRSLDLKDSHGWSPHVTTGADGSYRFLVAAPGRWHFHVRQADAPVVSPPAVLEVRPDQELTLDLALPSARVCGSFDHSTIPAREREGLEAFLFALPDDGRDLLWSRSGTGRVAGKVGMTGRFDFPGLRPGDYLLRLVRWPDEIIAQRHVAVTTGTVDLGQLAPDPTIDVAVPVDPGERTAPAGFGAWLRQVLPGCPAGAYRATGALHEGRLRFKAAAPGRYLVQVFAPEFSSHSYGFAGEPCGEPVPLEIRADGSTVPERLVVR